METTALAFSCNWSPPSDILVKAVPLSGNIQLLLCTLCMRIEREADVDSRRTNCQQQRGKVMFLPIMKEIHMSITFEKCTDIMACVHNYFWPWQCAMTAFRRLLFNHIFSFSCIAFPHALLFTSLFTASICCSSNNIIWPWSTWFYLASIPTFLLQTLFRSTFLTSCWCYTTHICYPPM